MSLTGLIVVIVAYLILRAVWDTAATILGAMFQGLIEVLQARRANKPRKLLPAWVLLLIAVAVVAIGPIVAVLIAMMKG